MKFKNVYLCGNLNGSWDTIKRYVIKHRVTDSLIVQTGDFGIGFEPSHEEGRYWKLNQVLKSTNNYLYVIRGNHDCPDYFRERLPYAKREHGLMGLSTVVSRCENIRLLPDWTVEDINGENWLFIGGAYSVDRKKRINGTTYWPDERIKYQDSYCNLKNIYRVVSHTAPSFCQPSTFTPMYTELIYKHMATDAHILGDVDFERSTMTRIYTLLRHHGNNIETWIYGHFKMNIYFKYNATEFVGLSENHIRMIL